MSENPVEVTGITTPEHFPKCPPGHPYTQFCEIDKLYIPSPHPCIYRILTVSVKIIICATKEICTPVGRKLVIEGKKQIKVKYAVKKSCESVYTAYFEVPFCTFIELKHGKQKVVHVQTAVEDISVKHLDSRHLAVSSIIFICPVFKKEHDDHPCPPKEQCGFSYDCHKPLSHPQPYDESDNPQPYEQNGPSAKYYYGPECPSCGLPEIIRVDPHYYYGK